MAIVANRGNPYEPIDISYCTPYSSGAGAPSLVAIQPGQIYFDTTNKVRWRSIGKGLTDWVPMEAEVT